MTDSTAPTTEAGNAHGRYVVIARRYRPQSFDELVGQEHVARALQQAISSDRVGHAYLFTGARGVGKTSAARILAKALNCERGPTPTPCNECDVCLRVATGDDVDVLEIDGASNRGIDEIRQLRQNVAVRPSRVRFKIYIIDEVHMLTKEAFNALLKTLEEPPEHVKFIFATTEPHKIPITILSRCQRFDFAGISSAAIQARLEQIASAEGVAIEQAALQILASRAAGSMRDSQSLLEQLLAVGHSTASRECSMASSEHSTASRERQRPESQITAADVTDLLGIAPAERLSGLVRHLVARDAAAALAELDATIQGGVEVGLLLDQLVGYFRDVMAATVGCPANQLLYAMPSQAEEVAQVGRQLGLAKILAIAQILDHTAARMRVSMHGRTLVEMAVVRICQLDELDDLAAIVAEMRGAAQSTSTGTAARPGDAKKNADARPVGTLARAVFEQSAATDGRGSEVAAQGSDLPHAMNGPTAALKTDGPPPPASAPSENESVLAQWQRALAEGSQVRPASAPPRPSRREQLAQIAEQPFVCRAVELFDIPPEKIRYTPPDGEQN